MKRSLFSIANLEYLSSFGVPKMKPNIFRQDWINLPCSLFFFLEPFALAGTWGQVFGVISNSSHLLILTHRDTICNNSFQGLPCRSAIKTSCSQCQGAWVPSLGAEVPSQVPPLPQVPSLDLACLY